MFRRIDELQVRYSESDRMGTFYNSCLLEWMDDLINGEDEDEQ